VRWKREDTGYAAAALFAALTVGYFVVANVGLLPSPLAKSDPQRASTAGVPSFGATPVTTIAPPVFATAKRTAALPAVKRVPSGAPPAPAATVRPVVSRPAHAATGNGLVPTTGRAVNTTVRTAGGLVDTVASVVRSLLGTG
jgi:hypothetical protein